MTNTMTYKGYAARIEYDDEDEIFVGRIAGIRDGVGFHADTVDDLREAFHEAVEHYIETCTKVGKDNLRADISRNRIGRRSNFQLTMMTAHQRINPQFSVDIRGKA